MKLDKLIENYKKGALVDRLPKAGSTSQDTIGTMTKLNKSQEELKSSLSSFWTFNDRILVVIMIVLIAFIIFLGILIWKYNSQITMVVSLIAGESGGIYFAINRMHLLYKESMAARILYQLLLNASTPDERNKIVDSINEFIKK